METYIAFLRGINVGGKNKIDMPSLKSAFEEIGFTDVLTYMNSGNVIFSSNSLDKDQLITRSEEMITERFQLEVPITVVLVKELIETLEHAPDWWGDKDKSMVHHAIFLLPPTRVDEVFQAVGEAKPEYEKVTHRDGVIFWSGPFSTYSKTAW
ncbi:DUF1697 domain-containing protein [Geomicrobium sp. JCM 19039]|uniref:DUF1697 domain-containing protein n=1 Tax=Geomicrobium sp. JCM 19039 TaxID=1460636 RepID=UPI00045F3A28|nr:DUF1697 domain-containing protein [Geomicrobium sp. JCM 19039]GAK12465.1 hypothetical protein JCM19039_2241 [Geomicrobium sp. JCM 19039]